MIRPMRPEDAAGVKYLCAEALGHEAEEAFLRQRIEALSQSGRCRLLVCADDAGNILGLLQAERYELLYGGSGYNIIALAVHPDARRRGIGGDLLQALEQDARENGLTFIRLNTRVERQDAHAFYGAMGYVKDKTQSRFLKRLDEAKGA